MYRDLKTIARSAVAAVLVLFFAIPNDAVGQAAEHLVSPSELDKSAVDRTAHRDRNIDTLNRFFSSPKAQDALQSAHMNPQQVKSAVSTLSDQELAQLASRANKAEMDFAAGNLTDHDLLIILICIAALVLIIVAVR
jgi:hypothetical protein